MSSSSLELATIRDTVTLLQRAGPVSCIPRKTRVWQLRPQSVSPELGCLLKSFSTACLCAGRVLFPSTVWELQARSRGNHDLRQRPLDWVPGQGNGHQKKREESGERVPDWEGVLSSMCSLCCQKAWWQEETMQGPGIVAQRAENLPSIHGQEDQKFKANLGSLRPCPKNAGEGKLAQMATQLPYPKTRPLLFFLLFFFFFFF